MFRISFMCDDKKLAAALRGLTGIAVGAPEAVPVINGIKKNGKVQAASSGSTVELFLQYAKTHKLSDVRAEELREFTKSIGSAPSSYGHFKMQLLKAGVLKKHGIGTKSYYKVLA
jgi:hypothetical protein